MITAFAVIGGQLAGVKKGFVGGVFLGADDDVGTGNVLRVQPRLVAAGVQGETVVLQGILAYLDQSAIRRGETVGFALLQLFPLAFLRQKSYHV